MGALNGIRVIDLSHVLAGPTATMFLADLGAEVIHVEPPRGDDARQFGPFAGEAHGDRSGYFISLNRGKKGMVLNLRHERGREVLRKLLVVSDVLVENYRPGTMEKLGFGWQELQRINPRLIYASISGFGHDAPPGYEARPSYDMVAQAYSGLMSITGPAEGPPCRVGTSIGDIIAGHQAAIGILAALVRRERTGRGQYYDGSLVDGLFSVLENAVVRYTMSGQVPGPLGAMHPTITPFQLLPTEDSWIVVAIGNDVLWERFCTVIERKDLLQDDRFRTNHLRCEYKEELSEILAREMRKKTTGRWGELFAAADLPYGPLNSIRDICEDPVIAHRRMLVEIEQPPVGKVRIAGSPIRLSESPGEVRGPAPRLGEHTREILQGLLGYTAQEVEELLRQGVVAGPSAF